MGVAVNALACSRLTIIRGGERGVGPSKRKIGVAKGGEGSKLYLDF